MASLMDQYSSFNSNGDEPEGQNEELNEKEKRWWKRTNSTWKDKSTSVESVVRYINNVANFDNVILQFASQVQRGRSYELK